MVMKYRILYQICKETVFLHCRNSMAFYGTLHGNSGGKGGGHIRLLHVAEMRGGGGGIQFCRIFM